MVDLRASVGGLELEHPLLLASGPLSWNGDAILRAFHGGAAAVVTKTISRRAACSPRPHIVALPHGVMNAERWSDLDPWQWVERELPRAKDGGATVIASLGLAADDVTALARALERAGADALEVVSYDEAALPDMVRAAVTQVRIPVLAKLSANGGDLAGTAQRCAECGASALTVIDSLGPALRIDLERRRPRVGSGTAWWSGSGILPIALHCVSVVRRASGVGVVGTGGVSSADEAIEMLYAGASAVGLCSAPLVEGVGTFARIRDRVAERLGELGMASVREAVGAMADDAEAHLAMRLDETACSGCGTCIRVCPYGARRSPADVDPSCRGCGLCGSLCPTGALGGKGSEA